MNVSKLETIEQIKEFLAGTTEVAFSNPTDVAALRSVIATVLRRYRYFRLSKGPRGVLFAYMQRLTGYPEIARSAWIDAVVSSRQALHVRKQHTARPFA